MRHIHLCEPPERCKIAPEKDTQSRALSYPRYRISTIVIIMDHSEMHKEIIHTDNNNGTTTTKISC